MFLINCVVNIWWKFLKSAIHDNLIEIASKLEKFSLSFYPFHSLRSVGVATNDRKDNKRHNIVLYNKYSLIKNAKIAWHDLFKPVCVGVSRLCTETVLQIDKFYTVVKIVFELTFRTVVFGRRECLRVNAWDI